MINNIKLVFKCFNLLFQPLFKGFLKLGQKYKNIFVSFLVQMKTLKFAFEINWPVVEETVAFLSNIKEYFIHFKFSGRLIHEPVHC